jgi:hypothetical protein
VAYGNLFETSTASEALMCRSAGGWAPDIGCLGNAVFKVRGVEVRDMAGSVADPNVPDLPAGTLVSDYVRVEGVWQGDALVATNVEPAERPSTLQLLALPAVPCEPPRGGWPSFPADRAFGSGAVLRAMVGSDPDTYTGTSFAASTGADGRIGELVALVGTLDDVESVTAELRSIHPFNLCVVGSKYSSSELQEIADNLSAVNPDWELQVDAAVGRVGVRIPVFDQAAADALAMYSDVVLVAPVVNKSR